jgi:pimeloyl-ACP methyl ester carboxylesterase
LPSILVQQRRIRYRDGGAGAPAPDRRTLLFLHGAGGSSAGWARTANLLTSAGNVVAVDLPAHGRSQGPPLAGIDAAADFALGLLEALGMRRAILLGHSMGGLIALRAAELRPERVEALVLVATAARIRVDPLVYDALDRSADQARALMTRAAFAASAPTSLVEMAIASWPYCTAEVARADFAACDAYDAGPATARLGMPALVVTASEDRLTPPALGARLADLLPGARLCEIGGAGHMLPAEHPAALARAIGDFLRSMPS